MGESSGKRHVHFNSSIWKVHDGLKYNLLFWAYCGFTSMNSGHNCRDLDMYAALVLYYLA